MTQEPTNAPARNKAPSTIEKGGTPSLSPSAIANDDIDNADTLGKPFKEKGHGRTKVSKKKTARSPTLKARLHILKTYEDGNPHLRRLVLRKVVKYLAMDEAGADGTLRQQLANIESYAIGIDLPGLMQEISNEILAHKRVYKFRK